MDLFSVVFYFMAAITVGSAILVVTSKNVMNSAFSLLFTFFGVAGLYVLLNADFLAITQIMIYIGGILVLIIFGVMLTTRVTGVDIKTGVSGKIQLAVAGIITLVLFILLMVIFDSTKWFMAPAPAPANSINPIGNELLTNYLLAFEAASVLLLVAIIGAALIARRKD